MGTRAAARLKLRASPAILAGIGLLLAGVVLYFALLGPTAVKTAGLMAEANRLDGQIQALTRSRQALVEAEKTLAELQKLHAEAVGRTLRAQDLPLGAGFLSDAAASAGAQALSVTYVLHGAAQAQDAKGATGASNGTVRFDVQLEGPYAALVRLVETVDRAFDRAEFSSLTISSAGRALQATLSFTVPVRVGEEKAGEPGWRMPSLPARPALAGGGASGPFEPADPDRVMAWLEPVGDPRVMALRVTGIVQGAGGLMAVLSVEERSHLVRKGTRLGELEVLAVRPDGVDLRVDKQRVFVPLGVR